MFRTHQYAYASHIHRGTTPCHARQVIYTASIIFCLSPSAGIVRVEALAVDLLLFDLTYWRFALFSWCYSLLPRSLRGCSYACCCLLDAP